MLPAVTVSVSKINVCGALLPAGFVGSGEGAPAGAARLVTTFTEVPAPKVVPLWNVIEELQEPSAGNAIALPVWNVESVDDAVAGALPHGNAAWGLLVGAVVGVEVGVVVGVPPDGVVLDPPLQPATNNPPTKTATPAMSRTRWEQKSVFKKNSF